jgi:hypothetical protein
MAKFDESHSSLGFFWAQGHPETKWPGRVFIDQFPRVAMHRLAGGPIEGSFPVGRGIIHGITDGNQYVTLFEASAYPNGIAFKSESATERVSVTANYMFVGYQHFDGSPCISRLSFSSAVIEHVLRLWASSDYTDIRYRDKRHAKTPYVRPMQVVSYLDVARRIRFRLFQPRVPTTTIEPMSSVVVDFLDAVTPQHAMSMLHSLRSLFALICGDVIDLWDIHLYNKVGASSDVYFYDPIPRPTKSVGFPMVPILDISHNRTLFRRVMAGWLAEPENRRIARGMFNSILHDKGTLRPGHLRDLITMIEMLVDSGGMAPLNRTKFQALRTALIEALDAFAADDVHAAEWQGTIRRRIDNLNSRDAKILLKRFIEALPEGFVTAPETFSSDVIGLRNTLVHDLGRLKPDHYNQMSFFIAKLKALYALSDAIALGGHRDEITPRSQFLVRAQYVSMDVFGNEPNEDAEG